MNGWRYTLHELAAALNADPPTEDSSFERVSTDTRSLLPGDVFFALKGDRFDGDAFVADAFEKGACTAVCTTASEAGPCLVVPDALGALQQFAAHHRRSHRVPLIALTGSCGKTSTKDLIAAVLATRYEVVKTQGNLNNDIGCPLSLLGIGPETDVAVIEMGANHLGEIASLCRMARPTEAAITMVAPAHLEGFGTIENVAKAKGEIVDHLPGTGTFYVNADDPRCVDIAARYDGRKVSFGRQGDVALRSCKSVSADEMAIEIDPAGLLRLPLACLAHAMNVALAVAVGLQHGVQDMEEPLRKACAEASRFRVVQVDGLEIVDDTYNANPASMAAALDTLAQRPGAGQRFAVLGDMLELGDAAPVLHREVGRHAGRLGIDHVFARGDHAQALVEAARDAGVSHAEVIDEHAAIAQALRRAAHKGDTVLVKGSRGMKMERVIEALRNDAG